MLVLRLQRWVSSLAFFFLPPVCTATLLRRAVCSPSHRPESSRASCLALPAPPRFAHSSRLRLLETGFPRLLRRTAGATRKGLISSRSRFPSETSPRATRSTTRRARTAGSGT
eukprot:Amastigsp_a339260_716.p3 type:complete len:113 gc:universal Amastigsp_a339260_716:318-656(+)